MVMMRSEDQEHGFSINGRTAPHEFGEHPDAVEPADEETERVNANDKYVKAYMEQHDHYQAAYNALEWRERTVFLEEAIVNLAARICGLDPEGGELPADLIERATAERGRLLERAAANENSLTTMTELVNRLQRFNMSMVTDTLEGRNAKDELRILAARFGVKVEPGDSAIVISHKIQADRFAGTSVMAKQTQ